MNDYKWEIHTLDERYDWDSAMTYAREMSERRRERVTLFQMTDADRAWATAVNQVSDGSQYVKFVVGSSHARFMWEEYVRDPCRHYPRRWISYE